MSVSSWLHRMLVKRITHIITEGCSSQTKSLWIHPLSLDRSELLTLILSANSNSKACLFSQGNNLAANQSRWIGTVFYLSFLSFEYPQNLALQYFPVSKWMRWALPCHLFTLRPLYPCQNLMHHYLCSYRSCGMQASYSMLSLLSFKCFITSSTEPSGGRADDLLF